jgi:receptor protein-tyrosine kinase
VPDTNLAFQDYLRMLRRRLWIIVLVVALAIGAAISITTLQDPVYRASMKIVVGQGGGIVDVRFGNSIESFTQTMTNLLESDIIAATVVDNLGLQITPRRLRSRLHVSSRPESAVLEVAYDASSRSQAVAVLAEVGEVFIQRVDQQLANAGSSEQPITATVFDPAHPEPGQVSPRPVRTLGIAGALGLVLGLILAFAAEAIDDRIRSRRDAEEWFGVPVIGALPKGLRGKPPFGVRGQPAPTRPEFLEALQLLRANLEFSERGMSGPMTVVTSAVPEEGKSTVVANLGVALALAGHDVVCVEGDLRRPRLPYYLALGARNGGLADVLEGRARIDDVLEDVPLSLIAPSVPVAVNGNQARRRRRSDLVEDPEARRTFRGRLRVMVGGSPTANPADVLTGERVAGLVDELRASADYVIFDTPPILLVGDAFPLVRLADTVIIVAREGKTNKTTAEAVKATLDGLGVIKASIVLTDSHGPTGYGYGYRAYGQDRVESTQRASR